MSSLDEFRPHKIPHLWPITLLRVYTGVFFLMQCVYNGRLDR